MKRDLTLINAVYLMAFAIFMVICPLIIGNFLGDSVKLSVLNHATIVTGISGLVILVVINLACFALDFAVRKHDKDLKSGGH